jgi:hypothetical protein
MMDDKAGDTDFFVIPEQRLFRSKREVLASIDEAIRGLLALRHLVDEGDPADLRPQGASHPLGGIRRRLKARTALIMKAFSPSIQ